jgi:hypothetical protein
MGSRLRGNDTVFAGMTWYWEMRDDSLLSCPRVPSDFNPFRHQNDKKIKVA